MGLNNIYGTGYECLAVGISSVIFAQIIKFFVHLIWKKQIDLRLFTTTGGMPSSHAAGVMGLSTIVGLICGWDSIEFAMALGYALVVMYDAAGVRRAAGKQAGYHAQGEEESNKFLHFLTSKIFVCGLTA